MTAQPPQTLVHAYEALHTSLLGWLRYKVGDEATAEDLLQEVFSRALLASQQRGLPQNPSAWLYTIARNAVVDFYRAKRPMLELPEDLPMEAEELASAAMQLSQCLLPLVQQLPNIYRDTLLATDFEGRNLQALADAWGISLSAVKSRASRGRKLLRERLLDCCVVELSHSGSVIDFYQKSGTDGVTGSVQLCQWR